MRISDWSSDVCSSDLAIYHYEKPEINDNLSSLTFDIFMKNLDNNRSFFLESDIQEFEKYRNTLDDAMKSGELAAPYSSVERSVGKECVSTCRSRWSQYH